MPYKSWNDVNPAIKGINPQPTLAQARLIADWADSIKERRGDVNPWKVAIALFEKTHHTEGTGDKRKWVKNKDTKNTKGLADAVLDLIEALEDLEVLPIVDQFPWWSEGPALGEDGIANMGGEPGYVVDLHSDVPQTADGRPDFTQPFRILPTGTIHRYGERTVTVADIEEFADNYRNRRNRGIRRDKIVIDIEHEPGGVGLYADIFSRGADGLWAKITLTPRGEQVLAERDFWFFSPTVAWESQDRVTGDVVRNQIVGGALTNYPVLGDATALPAMGYSDAALCRLWQSGVQLTGYATKTRDGVEYPASAWLVVPDPKKPDTWKLRVKEYDNGKLRYTRNMCSKAAQALSSKGFRGKPVQLSAAQRKKAKADLLRIYRNTLKVPKEEIPAHLFATKGDPNMTVEFTPEDRTILTTLGELFAPLFSRKGGASMSDVNGDPQQTPTIDREAFATLQTQVAGLTQQIETLGQERDALQQQVEQGQTQLAAEVQARQLQEMRQHAEQFSHLSMPLELPEDAPEGSLPAPAHFAWLYNADQTEGRQHWAFFNATLSAANAALEEASVFSELGSTDQPTSEDEKLHQQAMAYVKEHQVDYHTALKAVASGESPA